MYIVFAMGHKKILLISCGTRRSISLPFLQRLVLREVTAERADVAEVCLPFPVKSSNRLAYLAAFQARGELAPVTWGVIDSVRRKMLCQYHATTVVIFRFTMKARNSVLLVHLFTLSGILP